MTYRVGIVGFGIMGRRMADNMRRHDAFDVVAVYDPAPGSEDAPYVESAERILKGDDIDLVYIASPPARHAAHARTAARVGKPVFCEKPLGVDIADSERMVAAVEAAGVANAVNFSFASSPARAVLREMLAENRFGTVEGIDIRHHFARWPEDWQAAATWLSTRAEGGFVREVVSHFVYLIESVFGPAEVVWSRLRYPDGPDGTAAETHVWAELDCGGIPVSVAGGVGGSGPDRARVTVWGRDRSCHLEDWHTVSVSDGGAWTPSPTGDGDLRQAARMRQLDNLARFMAGEAHALPDFRAALSVQRVIERILTPVPAAPEAMNRMASTPAPRGV